MTNDNTARLWFAGKLATAHSLIAPIDTDAARGSAGHGEFVLEHRRDGDSLVIMLTRETDGPGEAPVLVSAAIPAALVRDLLDKAPEVRS